MARVVAAAVRAKGTYIVGVPDHDTSDATDIAESPEHAFAPPTGPAQPAPAPMRAGHLTNGWRIVTACAWIGVIVSFASIWNTSVQLGLSTWWLGPRGDPQPRLLRLSPFLVPLLMVIATLNNVRWVGRIGIGAAAATAAFGIGDIGRVGRLAALELLVAGLVGAVSIASLSGTYRRADEGAGAAAEISADPT